MAADETERLAFLPQLDTDGTPYVQLMWRQEEGAFTPQAARRAALALLEAAEQADLEHAMYEWLMADPSASDLDETERRAKVVGILAAFRQHREQPVAFLPAGGA